MYSRLSKWKKMIDSSSYGWSFLFWTFHIWYEVMRTFCYIHSPLFFFFAWVKLPQTLSLLQKLLFNYHFSTVFPQTNFWLLVTTVEDKLIEAFSDSMRKEVQLERFDLPSIPISQQLPRLTSPYFVRFLKWPLKLDCTFPWQHSVSSGQWITPEGWKLIPRK